MIRRLDLNNRPEDDPTMMSRWGPLSTMTRATRFGHNFYDPRETAESSQPFFGFPGGREGWIRWRMTGQMPEGLGGLGGRNVGRQLSPEQRAVYRARPDTRTLDASRAVRPQVLTPQPAPSPLMQPGSTSNTSNALSGARSWQGNTRVPSGVQGWTRRFPGR